MENRWTDYVANQIYIDSDYKHVIIWSYEFQGNQSDYYFLSFGGVEAQSEAKIRRAVSLFPEMRLQRI